VIVDPHRGASLPTRLRTLVLEDERPARNYLVELIEATQLAEIVGAVASIDEARAIIDVLSVDVVFVDVQLSCGENGLDFVRSFTRTPEGPATGHGPRGAPPPLFVLATAFNRHAQQAFDLGVVDYILKPFTEKRVEECIRRLVGRRPATGPPRA
jgi:DNA-binding LytR/AlgR family response regulator